MDGHDNANIEPAAQEQDWVSSPNVIQTSKMVIVGTGQNQSTIDAIRGFTGPTVKRVYSITSAALPAINTDLYDFVSITALATDITSFTTNLTGTPDNADQLRIRILDNGTARALTWGSKFSPKGQALPLTTVISKLTTLLFEWDSVAGVWGCLALAQET